MNNTMPANGNAIDAGALACIVVTYNPDIPTLARQFASLPAASALVVVDNASDPPIIDQLRELAENRERVFLCANQANRGLAAAINQGMNEARARWADVRLALLLDQDSEPRPGSIHTLLDELLRLQNAHPPAACVGPALLDVTTGLYHGFHQQSRWRWKRITPDVEHGSPVICSNLNGSGTLVAIDLFQTLGGLDEGLFIDHVDTEWAFRVQAAGYGLYGIPQAIFEHRMGEASRRIWLFGWRTWPMRSPQRQYYLFRNAVVLMRRDYVPRVWKTWAVLKLLLTSIVHGVMDPRRKAQVQQMLKGVREGFSMPDACRGSPDR